MNIPCPCQSSINYNICCGRYHKGKLFAPTAEALMRSRYSAYSLMLSRYLFKTWHKSTRPKLQSLLQKDDSEWLSLQIVKTEHGMEQDNTGIVTFIATYSRQKQVMQLNETSRFEKVNGKWVYVDAVKEDFVPST